MATATKSRRARQQPEEPANPVVARRLAFLPEDKRQEAAKRFKDGESIAKIAEDYDLSMTHAMYAVRQQLVESGEVSRIEPTAEALKKAADEEEWSDSHSLACRAGLSTGRVRTLLES